MLLDVLQLSTLTQQLTTMPQHHGKHSGKRSSKYAGKYTGGGRGGKDMGGGHAGKHPGGERSGKRHGGRSGKPSSERKQCPCWNGKFCVYLQCEYAHPEGQLVKQMGADHGYIDRICTQCNASFEQGYLKKCHDYRATWKCNSCYKQ